MKNPARDSRDEAQVVEMDLSRSTEQIDRDLRHRWPNEIGMWWELEPDEMSGWVYSTSSRILAKLVHGAP